MLITCPSCGAEYDVPGSVAPGRKVRCARCSSQWAPVPPPVAAPVIEAVAEPASIPLPTQPPAMPAVPPMPAPTAERPSPLVTPVVRPAPGGAPLLLAWSGSVLALAALVAAAVVWREPVMQAWPPSTRLYGALGLTAHP